MMNKKRKSTTTNKRIRKHMKFAVTFFRFFDFFFTLFKLASKKILNMKKRRGRTVGDFIFKEKLGSGSFADVYRAVHKITGREVAVKAIALSKMNEKLEKNLESEIAILQKIEHPNVVSLIGLQKSQRHMYLIMEMCAGGDLHKYIRKHSPLRETTIRTFMRHLSNGLRALWSSNLVHRDLKPQNLLLSEDSPNATLKIADFGFARHLAVSSMAETMCGSPLYMAPEILRLRKYVVRELLSHQLPRAIISIS